MEHCYKRWMQLFKTHPQYVTILNLINKIMTTIAFVLYPVLVAFLVISGDKRAIALIFVPAFCFVAVSIVRKILHRPRPYDLYDYQPVIPREKKGDSFPSRHVFSIFLIATLWIGFCRPVGFLLLLAGCILAIIRVVGGVHFPKDVLCGAVIGMLCGGITLYICLF